MKIGDVYNEQILITEKSILDFANLSGDYNPIHFDEDFAKKNGFKGRIAHGILSATFFSRIFATNFPGPGTIYLSQNLKFHAPVYVGETLEFILTVIEQKKDKQIFTIRTEIYGTENILKVSGEAVIKAQT